MLFLAWFFIRKFFLKDQISPDAVDAYIRKNDFHERLNSQEKKTVIIILGMIICWILGSWLKALNTTLVAIIGLSIMFLPGIQILTWKEFKE